MTYLHGDLGFLFILEGELLMLPKESPFPQLELNENIRERQLCFCYNQSKE